MFKLVKERTAWRPVVWNSVGEDGSIIENRIEMKFRVVGRSEFAELFLGAQSDEVGADALEKDMALARRIVAEDWRGVGDEKGVALSFRWELLQQLMDTPGFAQAFGDACLKLYQALPEIREKNSGASPASGPATAVEETPAPSPTS